jgi:ribosomal protein L7/L12
MINIEFTQQDATNTLTAQLAKQFKTDVSVTIKSSLDNVGHKVYDPFSLFTSDQWAVLLKDQDSNKIKWIILIRALTGKDLCNAKQFVEFYL